MCCCLMWSFSQARFVQLKSRTVLVLAAFIGIQVVSCMRLCTKLESLTLTHIMSSMSTAPKNPGNTGNLLEFDICPGNIGNFLKFN